MARKQQTDVKHEEVIERLDRIVRLLALQVARERSVTEAVRLLKMANLDNATIAEALDTTTATVRTLGSGVRANSGRGRRGR